MAPISNKSKKKKETRGRKMKPRQNLPCLNCGKIIKPKNKYGYIRKENQFCNANCLLSFNNKGGPMVPVIYPVGFKPTLYDPKYGMGGQVFMDYLKFLQQENVPMKIINVEMPFKNKTIKKPMIYSPCEIPSIVNYIGFIGTPILEQTFKGWCNRYPAMAEARDFIMQLREYYLFKKAGVGPLKSEKMISALLRKHGYDQDEEDKGSRHLHLHFEGVKNIYNVSKSAEEKLPDRLEIIKASKLYGE